MTNQEFASTTTVLIPVVVDVPLSVVEQVLNAQFGANVVSSLTAAQIMAAMRAYASPLASVPPEIPLDVNRQYILGVLEDVAEPVIDHEVVTIGDGDYPETYDELSPIDTGDKDGK